MANEAVEMEPSGRVLPIFRGEYDAGRTYENPDIVLYRNSSYVAKQVTVGNPPPAHALADDYWQMVARGIIDADVSDSTIEFTEASERSNIKSGEKSNIIMGKIMKFFTDLKDIAFSGRYSDLIDAPVSLKNPKVLTFTGAVTGSYDGSTAKSVAIPSVGNGTLTIQKNGTNIKTFTANQTGNVTANITVPTSASDVSAVPASKVLTTAEQINANTNSANVAGATAVKAMVNQINSNLANAMDVNDLLLNYTDKTSIWIQIDTLKNINNYKFIFFASMTGNSIVHCYTVPKPVFKTFHGATNFIQLGDSNVYFISDTKIGILSTSDIFRIYGIV